MVSRFVMDFWQGTKYTSVPSLEDNIALLGEYTYFITIIVLLKLSDGDFCKYEKLHFIITIVIMIFTVIIITVIQSRFKWLLFGIHVSLRFSGSKLLIYLRRLFLVHKFFSCTWNFLYTSFCGICGLFVLCFKTTISKMHFTLFYVALLLKLAD